MPLRQELEQIEQVIPEQKALRGERPVAEMDLRAQLQKATDLPATITVGKNVTGSNFIVGNENRISQYILPNEPPPPLFVGVPPMPTHVVGREPLVEKLVKRLVATGSLFLSAEELPEAMRRDGDGAIHSLALSPTYHALWVRPFVSAGRHWVVM